MLVLSTISDGTWAGVRSSIATKKGQKEGELQRYICVQRSSFGVLRKMRAKACGLFCGKKKERCRGGVMREYYSLGGSLVA